MTMAEPGPLHSRISNARRLSLRDWMDVAHAVLELAKSRRRVRRANAADLVGERRPLAGATLEPPADIAGRVSRAIGRAAPLVPWRSDCLVQAEAARSWLGREGLTTELRLGARKADNGGIEAHAWLLCDGDIVTGGEVESFQPFS